MPQSNPRVPLVDLAPQPVNGRRMCVALRRRLSTTCCNTSTACCNKRSSPRVTMRSEHAVGVHQSRRPPKAKPSPGRSTVRLVPAQMWAESRRRCGPSPGADVGRVPAQMWTESRHRCGPSPGAVGRADSCLSCSSKSVDETLNEELSASDSCTVSHTPHCSSLLGPHRGVLGVLTPGHFRPTPARYRTPHGRFRVASNPL